MNRSTKYQHLKKWNWGAFLATWIWGLGNNTYIGMAIFPIGMLCLLFFVLAPSLYLYAFSLFILCWISLRILHGVEGDLWAWTNNRWESVEQFRRAQRRWILWGIIINVILLLLITLMIVVTMNFLNQYRYPKRPLESNGAYEKELKRLNPSGPVKQP